MAEFQNSGSIGAMSKAVETRRSGLDSLVKAVQSGPAGKVNSATAKAETVVVTATKNIERTSVSSFLKDVATSQSALQGMSDALEEVSQQAESVSADPKVVIAAAKKAKAFLDEVGVDTSNSGEVGVVASRISESKFSNLGEVMGASAVLVSSVAKSSEEDVEQNMGAIAAAFGNLQNEVVDEQERLFSLSETLRTVSKRGQSDEEFVSKAREALAKMEPSQIEAAIKAQAKQETGNVEQLIRGISIDSLVKPEAFITEIERIISNTNPLTGLPKIDLPKKIRDVIIEMNPMMKLPPSLKDIITASEAKRKEQDG